MIPQLARVVPIESERHRIVARGHVVDPELAVPTTVTVKNGLSAPFPAAIAWTQIGAKFQRAFPVNSVAGYSLPTTGLLFPPRSMWTASQRKVALILPDEVTSGGALVDHEGDLAADPPGAGDHSLEHEPPGPVPSGRAVRRVDDGP